MAAKDNAGQESPARDFARDQEAAGTVTEGGVVERASSQGPRHEECRPGRGPRDWHGEASKQCAVAHSACLQAGRR